MTLVYRRVWRNEMERGEADIILQSQNHKRYSILFRSARAIWQANLRATGWKVSHLFLLSFSLQWPNCHISQWTQTLCLPRHMYPSLEVLADMVSFPATFPCYFKFKKYCEHQYFFVKWMLAHSNSIFNSLSSPKEPVTDYTIKLYAL
jgi:hypothetical protein